LEDAPACSGYGMPRLTSILSSWLGTAWSTYMRVSPRRTDSVAVSPVWRDSSRSSGPTMARRSILAM
jgi:hypothetical protein